MRPARTCESCSLPIPRGHNYSTKKYCSRKCYHYAIRYTDEKALETMWRKVEREGHNGCWIYTGNVNNMGYGAMGWRGNKMQAVHRLVYQLAHGNLAGPHVFCLHKCDTPRCVNPSHIFLGDDAANSADKVAKRRHTFGERNGRASISDAIAAKIISELKGVKGEQAALARKYGVPGGLVHAIAAGRLWKHLPRPSLPSTPTRAK